jgi:hypothetical protein
MPTPTVSRPPADFIIPIVSRRRTKPSRHDGDPKWNSSLDQNTGWFEVNTGLAVTYIYRSVS